MHEGGLRLGNFYSFGIFGVILNFERFWVYFEIIMINFEFLIKFLIGFVKFEIYKKKITSS